MSVTCPRCKSECWDTDRFCPTCGASLDEPADRADQRWEDQRDRTWREPASDDGFDFQPLEFALDEPRGSRGGLSGWAAVALAVLLIAIIAALVFGAMALMADDDDDQTSGASTAAIETGAVLAADGAVPSRLNTQPERASSVQSLPVGSLADEPARSMARLRAAVVAPVATPDPSTAPGTGAPAEENEPATTTDTNTTPITGDGTGGVGSDPDATIPLIDPQQPASGED